MVPLSSPTRDKLMNPAVFTPRAFSTYGVIHVPSNSPEVLMSLLRFSRIFFAPFWSSDCANIPDGCVIYQQRRICYIYKRMASSGERCVYLPQYPRLPKTGPLTLAKDFWNRYWGLAGTRWTAIGQLPETVPKVFAKVNSSQFPHGECHWSA